MVLTGLILGLRFVTYSFLYGPQGLIQSLILAASLVIIGVQTILMGLVADLIASSRSLVEDTLLRVRMMELRMGAKPDLEPGYHKNEDAEEETGESGESEARGGAAPR